MTWMSYLIPTVFMLAASGCESNVYVYEVRGRVVNDAGEAVANVPVHVETHTTGQPWNFWDGNEPVDGWDGKHDSAARTDSAGRFQTQAIGDVYTSWLYPLLPEPTAPTLPKVRVWFGRGDGWWVPAEVTSLTPTDQSRVGGTNSRGGNNTRQVELPQAIVVPSIAISAVRSRDWHRLDSK